MDRPPRRADHRAARRSAFAMLASGLFGVGRVGRGPPGGLGVEWGLKAWGGMEWGPVGLIDWGGLELTA